MENIENINIQFGIVLEEKASALTQGGTGRGTENRFAYMWPQ